MLNEQDRAKLDGIVQQMAANKEPDANIQMVVDDFKQKYSRAPSPVPAPTPSPETGIVQDIAQGVAKPFLGMASQVRDVATGVSDLATGVKQAIKGEPVVIPQRPNQTEYDYGYLGKVKSFGKATPDAEGAKALERAAGAGAGIASNIVAGGPVKSVGKSILARTLPKVIQLAKEGAVAGGMYGAGNAAQDGGSATDILSQGAVGAVTGAVATPIVGTAIPATVKPVTTTFDKLTKPLQTHISDVAQNINRALSTQGKKSIGVFLKNPQKQYKAFEIMHEMAPNLKVTDEAGDVITWDPKTTDFNQFAQAFKDAKDQTWKGISDAVTHATGKDLHVDAGPILDYLNKTAGSKYTTSEVRAAAQRLSDEVANMAVPGTNGKIPIAGLTEYNKVLNTKISGVLAGTTDNAVRDLEAGLAKQLSEAADTAVAKISDGRFSVLKDNYSALKTIEKDLVRRAQQESRQVDNSLGDFMSRYGTIELANGVFQAAHGNVGPLAKGIGAKILGAYSKKLRTPSTYLQKAFNEIDRFKSGEGIQNAAVRGVKAIKDASKNPELRKGMIDFNAPILPKKKVNSVDLSPIEKEFKAQGNNIYYHATPDKNLNGIFTNGLKDNSFVWDTKQKAIDYAKSQDGTHTVISVSTKDTPKFDTGGGESAMNGDNWMIKKGLPLTKYPVENTNSVLPKTNEDFTKKYLAGTLSEEDKKAWKALTDKQKEEVITIYRGQNSDVFDLKTPAMTHNMKGKSFTIHKDQAEMYTLSGTGLKGKEAKPTIIEGTIPKSKVLTMQELEKNPKASMLLKDVKNQISQMTEDDLAEGSLPENVMDLLVPVARILNKDAIDMKSFGMVDEIRVLNDATSFKQKINLPKKADKYVRDAPTGKFSTGEDKKYIPDSVKDIPEEDVTQAIEAKKLLSKPAPGDTTNILLEEYIPLFKKYGLSIGKMSNGYHGEIKNLIQEILDKSKKVTLEKQAVKKAVSEDTAGVDIMKERMGMFPKKK